MSNYSEAVYWLALINESGLKLNLIKPIIQRWCVVEKRQLANLFDLSPLDLATTFGLPDEEVGKLMATVDKLVGQAEAITAWQAQGFEPLIRTDPRYPVRLVYALPPVQHPLVLWTRGSVELLSKPGVTMLGSQDADDATAKFIDDLMVTLEAEEIGLVSGYGRGLDRVTFEMMLSTENGYAVAILPMGLNAFTKTTTKLEPAIEAGRVVLVSPFGPDTAYHEKLAEARNLLIDHLTLTLLIPESDEDSQIRAIKALERGLPVFVKANTAGNRALIDQGALLLTDSGEVVEWVQQALVDDAMLDSEDESDPEALVAAPLIVTAPADHPIAADDYSLTTEDVLLLDSDEAIEVLSLGGAIPDVLRQRLKKPDNEDE